MSLNDIKLGLKRWMHAELKFTVIFGDQNTPKPSRLPYAVIIFGVENALGGQDEQREIDDNGVMTVIGQRDMIVSLEILGPDALDKMQDLQESLGKESVLDELFGAFNLSVLTRGPIQNLTGLLETDFEERAQMDIMIGYASVISDDVGRIERVEITPEINGNAQPTITVDLP